MLENVIIDSDNGLSPVRHQAITWTNAVILSIRLLEHISVKFHLKVSLKMSSVWWRPFCPNLDVLTVVISVLYAMPRYIGPYCDDLANEISYYIDNSIGCITVKVRSHCVRVRISFSIRFSFRVRRTVYTESQFLSVFDLILCPQLSRQTSKCDFV